jgi:hypothetical protein
MLPVWRTLQDTNVPVKIKIHCWRVLLGAIPCNGVPANKHMQQILSASFSKLIVIMYVMTSLPVQ